VAPPAGITEADLEACRAEAKAMVKAAVDFADASPPPPAGLGTYTLEYINKIYR
jgi:TPP-dependent pyruvate/acetoin dehydrogenase alpha subunit